MEYDDKHSDTAWRQCIMLEVSDNTVECTFLALQCMTSSQGSIPKTWDCNSAYIPVFWDAGYQS